MSKSSYLFVYLAVIGSLIRGGTANMMTAEENRELYNEMEPSTALCMDEFGLTVENIEEIKEHGKLEDLDPCFIRCSLEKGGLIDADGMYDHSSAQTLVTKFVKHEDRLKKLTDAMEACLKVNDMDVSAGKQGVCERAVLLFKCVMYVDGPAVTDAQRAAIQSKLVSSGIACIKDYPLSLSEIKSFRNKMIPDGETAKCFAACLFKKVGIMDDKGKLSPPGVVENAKQVFKGNEEHLKNVDEIMQKCSTVNEQSTGDGDKGCDRAKLAFVCLAENAPKYGFDVNF